MYANVAYQPTRFQNVVLMYFIWADNPNIKPTILFKPVKQLSARWCPSCKCGGFKKMRMQIHDQQLFDVSVYRDKVHSAKPPVVLWGSPRGEVHGKNIMNREVMRWYCDDNMFLFMPTACETYVWKNGASSLCRRPGSEGHLLAGCASLI